VGKQERLAGVQPFGEGEARNDMGERGVERRGRLIESMTRGGMASVPAIATGCGLPERCNG
jgi:hypothetical protein